MKSVRIYIFISRIPEQYRVVWCSAILFTRCKNTKLLIVYLPKNRCEAILFILGNDYPRTANMSLLSGRFDCVLLTLFFICVKIPITYWWLCRTRSDQKPHADLSTSTLKGTRKENSIQLVVLYILKVKTFENIWYRLLY